MNKPLQKKLLSYSAMATALLAVEKQAGAQIIYHEVNPNYTIVSPPGDYLLDLNGDGTYDFKFGAFSTHTTRTKVYAKALGSNDFSAFPQNYLVSAPISFIATHSSILATNSHKSGTYRSGDWNGLSNEYMPLKIVLAGKSYLGWVRLSVNIQSAALVISDYAYDLTPRDTIYMGQRGCAYKPITAVVFVQGGDTLKSTKATKYQWYSQSSTLAGDTSQSLTVSKAGVYSVITTDSTGCKTQSSPVIFSPCVSVRLHNSSITPVTGCTNPISAVIAIDSIPQNYTVQWYRNDTIINTSAYTQHADTFSFNNTISTLTHFYLIATDSLTGCTDTSDTISYNVFSAPAPPVLTQKQDTLITTYSSKYTYAWYELNGLITNDTTNYYLPNISTQYKVVITDRTTGCSSADSISYNSCYKIPLVVTASDTAIGCTLDSLVLHSYSDTGLTYSWLMNGTPINGATDSNYIATQPGTYRFLIDDTAQFCSVGSVPFVIGVATYPSPVITASHDTLFTGSFSSYQWYKNGDSIPGATNQFYIPDTSGTYNVDVTNSEGCSSFAADFVYIFNGIFTLASGEPLKIYTNEGDIYIDFPTPDFLNGSISLYSIEGQKLEQRTINNSTEIINARQLPKGIYFVLIIKDDVKQAYKIALL